MRKLRLLVLLLAAVSAMLVAPTAAYACSCVSDQLSELVDADDVVVRGTIESRDVKGFSFPVMSSGDEVVYRMTVEHVYQGTVGQVIEVQSVRDSVSCGIEVDVGGAYVVMAAPHGGKLHANLCGGTGQASPEYLAEVERTLGPGAPPDPSIAAPDQPVSIAGWTAGGLAVALLAGVALSWRRRKADKG
ncbi:MAG: hypothetical protein ACRDQ0_18210 [Pseudonocardia sp.]